MMKYQTYTEYQDSGVDWLGNIPSHWEIVPVGRLFTRLKRTGFPDQELLSVYRDYGVIPKSSRDDNNNKPSDDLGQYQLVNPNDLVMNKMKAWQGSIAISEYEGIVSPAYFVYQPLRSLFKRALPKYVHYLLRNPRYIAQYLRQSKGIRVNQWDLDPEEFQRIELVLPPKSEQNQIFKFLDYETAKIDSLIEKQQQLIQLLKEKRQAVISHAVTKGLNPNVPMKDSGVEWLGQVPEHWEVTRFSYEIFFQEGPGILAVDFHETGIPLLRIQNVKSHFVSNNYKTYLSPSKVLSKWDHYRVEKGDLIISCSASTGLVSEVDESTVGAIPYTGLIRLKPRTRKIISQYIKLLVQSDLFFEQIEVLQTGSTIQHFGPFHLQQMYISLPAINEQQIICYEVKNRLDSIDVLISKAESAIELIQERRTALISAAVTGKIDVRNWQNPTEAKMEFSA